MACMSVTSLVGCGGRAKPDFDWPDGGFNVDNPVTIRFYHSMGQSKQDILADYIAEFNKLYPNITVDTSIKFGDYDAIRDKINTEIIGGQQPNLAYCYADHVAGYNISKAVLPLNDFQPNGAFKDYTVKHADGTEEPVGYTKQQVDDFFEVYYKEGSQFSDGKMYMLPLAKSTEVLYYNKDFFDANNLTVPTTWDEMENVCKKIKEIDSSKTPLGYDSEANWFITMCEQSGSEYTSATGNHYRFNNAANRAFVTKFKGWYDKGYVITKATANNAYTSTLFKEQKTYMCIGSSAGATYQMPGSTKDGFDFEVDIAPIPQVDPANPKAISQGPSICIFKNEDPQAVLASWLFAKFLTTSIDFQAEFSFDSGYAPVIKTVTENEIYQAGIAEANGKENLVQLAIKTCMENSDSYFTSPAFNGSSKARDEVGNLLASVFSGTVSVNQAFENAIDECENN